MGESFNQYLIRVFILIELLITERNAQQMSILQIVDISVIIHHGLCIIKSVVFKELPS